MLFLSPAHFALKNKFRKKSRTLSLCQLILIQISTDVLLVISRTRLFPTEVINELQKSPIHRISKGVNIVQICSLNLFRLHICTICILCRLFSVLYVHLNFSAQNAYGWPHCLV